MKGACFLVKSRLFVYIVELSEINCAVQCEMNSILCFQMCVSECVFKIIDCFDPLFHQCVFYHFQLIIYKMDKLRNIVVSPYLVA